MELKGAAGGERGDFDGGERIAVAVGIVAEVREGKKRCRVLIKCEAIIARRRRFVC